MSLRVRVRVPRRTIGDKRAIRTRRRSEGKTTEEKRKREEKRPRYRARRRRRIARGKARGCGAATSKRIPLEEGIKANRHKAIDRGRSSRSLMAWKNSESQLTSRHGTAPVVAAASRTQRIENTTGALYTRPSLFPLVCRRTSSVLPFSTRLFPAAVG